MATSDEQRLKALRRRAEAVAKAYHAEVSRGDQTLSPAKTIKTLHELRVHQIELEMQNEELRSTQLQLDAERDRYFQLYDMAPVGYLSVNEKGLILQANLSATQLLKGARIHLARQSCSPTSLRQAIRTSTTCCAEKSLTHARLRLASCK